MERNNRGNGGGNGNSNHVTSSSSNNNNNGISSGSKGAGAKNGWVGHPSTTSAQDWMRNIGLTGSAYQQQSIPRAMIANGGYGLSMSRSGSYTSHQPRYFTLPLPLMEGPIHDRVTSVIRDRKRTFVAIQATRDERNAERRQHVHDAERKAEEARNLAMEAEEAAQKAKQNLDALSERYKKAKIESERLYQRKADERMKSVQEEHQLELKRIEDEFASSSSSDEEEEGQQQQQEKEGEKKDGKNLGKEESTTETRDKAKETLLVGEQQQKQQQQQHKKKNDTEIEAPVSKGGKKRKRMLALADASVNSDPTTSAAGESLSSAGTEQPSLGRKLKLTLSLGKRDASETGDQAKTTTTTTTTTTKRQKYISGSKGSDSSLGETDHTSKSKSSTNNTSKKNSSNTNSKSVPNPIGPNTTSGITTTTKTTTTPNQPTTSDQMTTSKKSTPESVRKAQNLEKINSEIDGLNEAKSQMVWLLKQVITAENKRKAQMERKKKD